MEEIWKDIPGYEGRYQASDLGRVKSLERTVTKCNGTRQFVPEKILKPMKNRHNYFGICLNRKLNILKRVHRLVAETFLGESDKYVNHINGNKADNRLVNLEYVSNLENMRHWSTTLKDRKKFGASFNKDTNKWRAVIQTNKKLKHLGYFETEEEAHNIFYIAYFTYHGVTPW